MSKLTLQDIPLAHRKHVLEQLARKSLLTPGAGKLHAEARMNVMTIMLPFCPSANRYWRCVNGMMILSAEARAFKKLVTQTCFIQGIRPQHCLVGPISISLAIYRKRKARDLDNCIKVVLDSLQGILYADDSQIDEIHAKRFEDKERPRIEVQWAEKRIES